LPVDPRAGLHYLVRITSRICLMRIEIEKAIAEIEQVVSLLRRHL
jgi:hypothetical protein